MPSYQCLIVDDERLARELITAHLKNLPDFEIVACCASAIEAQKVLQENHIDLMFLDIEMPVLKGTDFYQNLRDKPQVIFTTAYRDYALEGFELEALDYLLKPIVFSRFFKAIEKFRANHASRNQQLSFNANTKRQQPAIFVRENRRQVKLVFNNIYYVQGLKDYLKIYTTTGHHVIKSTMNNFERQLPSQFIRVHRSYIVNKNHITAYTNQDIEINDHEIPIGENYKKAICLT